MPVVSLLVARQDRAEGRDHDEVETTRPEEAPLFLPHSLSTEELQPCVAGLVDMEMRLREGQMRNALDTLRLHLHIKSRQLRYKNQNVRHQKPNTRAREKIEGNEAKLRTAMGKYRAAWNATKKALGEGEWMKQWRELKQTDVRCLQEDDGGVSEGRRRISWIWMSADTEDDDSAMGLNAGEYTLLNVRMLLKHRQPFAWSFSGPVHKLYVSLRRFKFYTKNNDACWNLSLRTRSHGSDVGS